MRKSVLLVAAVPALLAAGVVGASIWSGRAVTSRLEQQTVELTRAVPAFKIIKQQVQHGVFHSTRELTLQLGCLPNLKDDGVPGATARAPEPIQLQWVDVVHHGPLPEGNLGVASIDSALLAPPAWKERIERLVGKQAPLKVHTAISFQGDFVSDLSLPSLQYKDPQLGSVSVTSIQARVQGKAQSDSIKASTYRTDAPGFELSTHGADGTSLTVKLGALHAETTIEPRLDPKLWFGASKSTTKLASLELRGAPPSSAAIEPVQVVFGETAFEQVSKLDKGLFSNTSSMLTKGRINQTPVDKVELRASMKNLDAATYQKLLHTMLGTLFSCDPAAQQTAIATMYPDSQKELAALLVHNPEYSVDTLAVELSGKRAELSYSIGTSGVTASDASLPVPALLMMKGKLRAAIKVDVNLIAQAINKMSAADPNSAAAAGLPVAPAGAAGADATLTFINSTVDQFVQLGYLQRQGDMIEASASFEQGSVLINGKPMPLPDLAALAGGK